MNGKQDTSWFASFAPADDPELVVVAQVSQGGTGSTTAAPLVARCTRASTGSTARRRPCPAAGCRRGLPVVLPDGTVGPPTARAGSAPAGTGPVVTPGPAGAAAVTSPIVLRPRSASLRERALRRESPLRRLDLVLALSVAALVVLGALLVWSATRQRMLAAGLDPQTFLKKHALNATIGLVLGTGAALVDYRALRAYAPVVYALSCLGLVVVLSPLGATINGAHSWIVLPAGFQIQPSEFAKVAIVVGMAMILGEKRDGEDVPRDADVLLVLSLTAVPMALIMLQPDLGTTLVIVFIVLGALAVAAAPTRWIGGLLLAGVVVCPARCSSACSTSTRSTASRPSPTRSSTPAARATTPARRASRSGPGSARQGAVRGDPDQRPVHPRAADRLRVHRRGGGARPGRRRHDHRPAGAGAGRGLRIARGRRTVRPLVAAGVVSAGSPSRASSTSA